MPSIKFLMTVVTCIVCGLAGLSAQVLDSPLPPNIKNPLIEHPGMSDPHMLVVNDTCYLFTGHDIGFGISDWIMPDWRIYRSTDLQNWEHVGTIDPMDNYMGKGNTNCWAGDIVARNNKYYWFFSNRKESTGVMVATKPEGPYIDALGKPIVDSFDPTIFVDSDNTAYIIYGEGTYKIARLNDSMLELDEEPKEIIITGGDLYRCCGDKNSLHKNNGIYYLSYSGLYATSQNIYGPYEIQGVVGKGFGVDTHFAHGDFFIWKGNWYHTWCRYRNRSKDRIRDCFMAPTYYRDDGTMFDDYRHIDPFYKTSGID